MRLLCGKSGTGREEASAPEKEKAGSILAVDTPASESSPGTYVSVAQSLRASGPLFSNSKKHKVPFWAHMFEPHTHMSDNQNPGR